MKIKLIVILIVLVFTGCYQTTLYYWGNYSNSLYNYKKLETEENLNKHIKSIEKIIKQSDYLKKKVPPGIYCEYGYYSMQEGNYSEAFVCMLEDNSEEAKICSEFLIKYVLYSLTITKEIGEDIYSADHVMATGFNWIPPLAVIDAFGGCEQFRQIIDKKILPSDLTTIDIDELLRNVPHSIYDYRPFFMAF
jgi:hypothetical protein